MKIFIVYFILTIKVHPFCNIEAMNSFLQWAFSFLAVRAQDGLRPLLTSWWDGLAAIILDTTNTNSTQFFIQQLEAIRTITGIDSFKIDAGEYEWLTKNPWLANAKDTPEQF
jgi:hypothetical protein